MPGNRGAQRAGSAAALLWATAAMLCLLFAAAPARAITCDDQVAIVPPAVDDPEYASWLGDLAARQLEKDEKLHCHPVLPYDDSASIFDLLSMTSNYPRSIDVLRPKQTQYLVKKLEVDMLMTIELKRWDDPAMTLVLYHINGAGELKKQKRTYRLRIDRKLAKAHRAPKLPAFLAALAPNAVTTGFATNEVYFAPDPHYVDGVTTSKGLLPPLISAASLTQIENPLGYGTWDAIGSIFPGSYLFSIDQETELDRKPDTPNTPEYPESVKLHIQTTGACANLNASGSLFWPAGTTYGGIGWGPCLQVSRVEHSHRVFRGNSATRFFFGHRVFLSARVYLLLDVDLLEFSVPLYESPYAKASEIERVLLGVGWYLPDSEGTSLACWRMMTDWF